MYKNNETLKRIGWEAEKIFAAYPEHSSRSKARQDFRVLVAQAIVDEMLLFVPKNKQKELIHKLWFYTDSFPQILVEKREVEVTDEQFEEIMEHSGDAERTNFIWDKLFSIKNENKTKNEQISMIESVIIKLAQEQRKVGRTQILNYMQDEVNKLRD